MLRRTAYGLGLVALLAACASANHHDGVGMPPPQPRIIVKNGVITEVIPDPLKFAVEQGKPPHVIHWEAPAGYEFAGDGIVIEGEVATIGGPIIDPKPSEVGQCRVTGNRLKVQCNNKRGRKGIYKYTIYLQKDGVALPKFDPFIMNG